MSVPTRNQRTAAQDETEIRRLIATWSKALESKDLDGITADYAPDALLYDAIPPYKTIGADAIRTAWQSCLPCFPDEFASEHRDLVIHVDGDLAVVHGLHHFLPSPAGHPCGQTWMRVTVCYRLIRRGRSGIRTYWMRRTTASRPDVRPCGRP
jgi:uncharacterized protein (TIGR02246 family)